MRRGPGFASVVAVALLSMVVGGVFLAGAATAAQEASPPPGGFEIAPGVMAEAIAFAEGREDPSVYRLTFAPAAIYMFGASPTLELAYLESGTLLMTLGAPVTVTRAGGVGEQVDANTAFTVEAGDYFVLAPFTTGDVRNEGEEPAVLSVANLVPGGTATPAATPAT